MSSSVTIRLRMFSTSPAIARISLDPRTTMLWAKSPPAIRRHEAASTARGRVTARRINSPSRIAPATNAATMAIRIRSRQLRIASSSLTATVRAAPRSAFWVSNSPRMRSNSALPRAAVEAFTTFGAPGITLLINGCAYVLRHAAPARSIAVRSAIRSTRFPSRADDVPGRLLFDALPVDVRSEELPVGGNHVAAQGGLLVTQRALQLIRRDTRRLNVIGQLTGHCVGAVQQHRTCGCRRPAPPFPSPTTPRSASPRPSVAIPAAGRPWWCPPAPSVPSSPDAALYPHHGDVVAEPAMCLGPSLGLVDERVDELRAL